MNGITSVYYKLRGPFPITEIDALTDHQSHCGYRLLFFRNNIIHVEITVHSNFSLDLHYYDEKKRWRWACHWTDKAGCGNNQLSNIYCFTYIDDNISAEENYKSHFTHYNMSDKRKDYVRYFHLGTAKGKFCDFNQRRTYCLPYPEFGKYEDYLNFAYQEKFPELEEWPKSIFPRGEKPQKNIPIPQVIL